MGSFLMRSNILGRLFRVTTPRVNAPSKPCRSGGLMSGGRCCISGDTSTQRQAGNLNYRYLEVRIKLLNLLFDGFCAGGPGSRCAGPDPDRTNRRTHRSRRRRCQENHGRCQALSGCHQCQGGIHGQKIELISLDDKFEPKLAQENARKLIEENNIAALFLTRGTSHT